jgi:uncharacterized protein YggU (UPF0235/DUF167 family)
MFPRWTPETVERCTLLIRLKPAAKHDAVFFSSAAAPLQVAVTAPPIENRANERCIALLAKRLGVPKSNLRIIKGGHCRDKVIACEGVSEREALCRLGGK